MSIVQKVYFLLTTKHLLSDSLLELAVTFNEKQFKKRPKIVSNALWSPSIFETNGNPVKEFIFRQFSETTSCIRIHDIVGKEYAETYRGPRSRMLFCEFAFLMHNQSQIGIIILTQIYIVYLVLLYHKYLLLHADFFQVSSHCTTVHKHVDS